MLYRDQTQPISFEANHALPHKSLVLADTLASSSLNFAMAKWLCSIKENRPEVFRGKSAEPAWDILCDLYIRELSGKRTSISSACISSHMPSTTAFRHIHILCETNWLHREGDEYDKRRHWLTLSPQAKEVVEKYLEDRCKDIAKFLVENIREISRLCEVSLMDIVKMLHQSSLEEKSIMEIVA